jgi:Peptidase A4 family
VSADWIVPRAKQHKAGEEEFSSSWIGVGGGCLDTSCTASDDTLIQAGIEHDVDASGNAHYYAWWEAIPAPLVSVDLAVRAGDLVHVDISESVGTPGVWTITIADRTTGGSFAIQLPYASSYGTVEWVIETPVVITESGVRVGPMPDLATVRFDNATANGSAVRLVPAEQIQLVDTDLSLIARPSLPDHDANGFNDCTYRRQCPTPGSDLH